MSFFNLTHLLFNLTHLLFNFACLLFNLLGLCGPCPILLLLTPKSRGFWYSSTSCVCLVACVACHTVGVCICGQCVFFLFWVLGCKSWLLTTAKTICSFPPFQVAWCNEILGCSICLANCVSGLVLYDILSHAPVLAGVPRSYSCGSEWSLCRGSVSLPCSRDLRFPLELVGRLRESERHLTCSCSPTGSMATLASTSVRRGQGPQLIDPRWMKLQQQPECHRCMQHQIQRQRLCGDSDVHLS